MTNFKTDELIRNGILAHKAGNYLEAERNYGLVLKVQPKNPTINHNMGVIKISQDRLNHAVQYFRTALDAKPSEVQYCISLTHTLIKLARADEAEKV